MSTESVMTRVLSRGTVLIAFVLVVYQMLSVWFPVATALAFYYAHLGLVLALLSVKRLASHVERRGGRIDLELVLYYLALVGAVGASSYFYTHIGDIELRQPFIEQPDFIAAAALIGALLILSWYIWGKVLTGLMVLAILYFFFGDLVPGSLHYEVPDYGTVVSYLAGMGGARGVLWGIPLSANTLFLIIVFGGLLQGTRILEMFNEIGTWLLGLTRGGICYSAIFASSAIGMVTGQAVANIALSGAMTIPAMRQRGLSGEQAGAVEVVASLGSQLLPPIMGLGGFLMAVNLGVPYIDVVTAALIPALLYVATVILGVRQLVRANPKLVKAREPVDGRRILWLLPSFLISFVTLIALLYQRYSPGYAAFWSIFLLVGLSFLRPASFRPTASQLLQGMLYGVVAAAELALILAGIGLVVQVLVTTGAGFDFGRIAMNLAGDSTLLALFLGMGIALLVGLGLPTPAAYALIAIIMIPFLIDLGIEPMVAHFFGFYFAIFSAVTPPVAVGAMTAARISGSSFYGTVLESAKLSAVCILIPFSFVAFPSLLAFPDITLQAVVVSVSLLVATTLWGASVYGVLSEVRLGLTPRLLMLLGPIGHIVLLLTRNLWFALIPVVALLGCRLLFGRRAGAVEVGYGNTQA